MKRTTAHLEATKNQFQCGFARTQTYRTIWGNNPGLFQADQTSPRTTCRGTKKKKQTTPHTFCFWLHLHCHKVAAGAISLTKEHTVTTQSCLFLLKQQLHGDCALSLSKIRTEENTGNALKLCVLLTQLTWPITVTFLVVFSYVYMGSNKQIGKFSPDTAHSERNFILNEGVGSSSLLTLWC